MSIRSAKNILSYSLNVASDNGGTVVCTSANTLPSTNNIVGTHAFTEDTNKLYIWNGAAWVNIALINTNPTITQGANASYTLATDGTPTVITLAATDPEGLPITWSYSVTTGSLTNSGGATATVTQNDNEFTITPTTNEAYAGTFGLTFTASDGVNIATNVSSFELTFALPIDWGGDTAVFAGGSSSTNNVKSAVMDYIVIPTLGNATLFASISVSRYGLAGLSSGSRGVFGGGWLLPNASDTMDYITFAILGNAVDFGNLYYARNRLGAASSGTRGVFAGGFNSSNVNTIDYITIATKGNATYFGALTVLRAGVSGVSNGTRGVFGGSSVANTIDYITFATTGGATNFGDLTVSKEGSAACSDNTYGVFAAGASAGTITVVAGIDYITIATTGNATSFGTISVSRYDLAGCSNGDKGVFAGGATTDVVNVIDYISIATPGNAVDAGNLYNSRFRLGAASGS